MRDRYDVVVVGAGPAGYVAAIRCAQLGYATACIDAWKDEDGRPRLGGTCLNAGCIPSKALLESSELYQAVQNEFAEHGIRVQGVKLDLAAMQARKRTIVQALTDGIATLFQANGVDWLPGRGRLLEAGRVEFQPERGKPRHIEAGHVILATGSHPIALDTAPVDGERILDSSGALALAEVPRRLGIIGAGVIGLELGSVWKRLGAEEVILFEAQPDFLPMVDESVRRVALRAFDRQGLDIRLGTRVTATRLVRGRVEVTWQRDGETEKHLFDRLIVAVGRVPNSAGLAAPEAGLLIDEWGYVHVDEHCRTNLPGVYAIGDLVRGPMLAHKGAEEGIMVAERIAGHAAFVDYDRIPSVIYTHPEIAWIGRTEAELKRAGIAYRSGQFPFSANGRARAHGHPEGLVRVLSDAGTDRILGVHMIGDCVSELLSAAGVGMALGASAEDVALTMFAHPTLSEAFHEAAMAVAGNAIHAVTKR
ncbi:MAG: dihydrolipoyl dehydrogenase [Gammaproteobacteria bacterium]|nr:MAG: dihydrolipoyl dehydrogenase [Gammaproteobacteria bacterium]